MHTTCPSAVAIEVRTSCPDISRSKTGTSVDAALSEKSERVGIAKSAWLAFGQSDVLRALKRTSNHAQPEDDAEEAAGGGGAGVPWGTTVMAFVNKSELGMKIRF